MLSLAVGELVRGDLGSSRVNQILRPLRKQRAVDDCQSLRNTSSLQNDEGHELGAPRCIVMGSRRNYLSRLRACPELKKLYVHTPGLPGYDAPAVTRQRRDRARLRFDLVPNERLSVR